MPVRLRPIVLDDPFGALGLTADASADEVRGARRRLAMEHHPDRGGDASVMRIVNDAADAALRRLSEPLTAAGRHPAGEHSAGERPAAGRDDPTGTTSDVPSFTVEALPAETFEALVIVASWLGDVLDDEPPYRLDVDLGGPIRCWCRLDLVPDAGATTASITIGAIADDPLPDIELVRDVWVDGLNRLDWGETGPNDPR
jgi:hypothetical protein